MRDWELSGAIKIERAFRHVRDLHIAIDAFRERRPYVLVRDEDPHPHGTAWTISERERVPPFWSAVAADCIHNLHVAMDYLWQRSIHGTKHVSRDYFPAFANPEKAKARFRGREKGNVRRAINVLLDLEAFETDNPFWAIRCFDDADKHDTMAIVACTPYKFSARLFGETADTYFAPLNGFVPLKDGAKFKAADVFDPDVEVDLAIEIAFGEGEVLKGQPVLQALDRLTIAVDGLVTAFVDEGLL